MITKPQMYNLIPQWKKFTKPQKLKAKALLIELNIHNRIKNVPLEEFISLEFNKSQLQSILK